MKHQLLKGFFIFLFLTACNNPPSKTHEEHQEIQKEEIVMPLPDKRWEANAETTQGISNMQDLVQDFKEPHTRENYDLLRNQLESEFSSILKKCTMKGEAHDNLHDYLMPMKTYFNDLQSTDIPKARNAYDNLVVHLAMYKTYFE